MIPPRADTRSQIDGAPSPRIAEKVAAILCEDSPAALITLFTAHWPLGMRCKPDTGSVYVDLYHWLPVLNKIHGILDDKGDDLALVNAALVFLGDTVYHSRNKGCCHFIKSIGKYLTSSDSDVAESAAFALYAYCSPCPFACTFAESEAKESYEARKAILQNNRATEENEVDVVIAESAFVIFESLGLVSTEHSLFDYLRGSILLDLSDSPTVQYTVDVNTSFSIPVQAHVEVADVCDPSLVSASALLSLTYIARALNGLHESVEARMKLVRMRLLCLYLVLHSRFPNDRIAAYLNGGLLVPDLIALADKASDASADLTAPVPSALAFLALENLMFLIDVNGFRRSESNLLHRATDVCDELGLSLSRALDSSLHSLPWLSILLSCCATANAAVDGASYDALKASDSRHGYFVDDMRYARAGMRLFASCVGLQDHIFPSRELSLVGEASSIGPIVSLVHNALPTLKRVIYVGGADKFTVVECELLWTLCRVIGCLELTVNYPAFRECGVLAVVGELIKMIAFVWIEALPEVAKILLEKALGLLGTSIGCSRRSFLGPLDSGVNCVYQHYFSVLSLQIFQGSFTDSKFLWYAAIELIAAAVNAEPAFLSNFLASEYAAALLESLQTDFTHKPPEERAKSVSFYKSPNGYIIFLSLLKLVLAISITNEGVLWVNESRIPQSFVNGISFPCQLLPQCQGIPTDVLRKCGRYLGQIFREVPSQKRLIYEAARTAVLFFCYECVCAQESQHLDQAPDYCSPRMQALQKLYNICTVIENCTSEGRRSSNELLKDFLKEDVVDGLFQAFACTIPLPTQLYAQFSIVHNSQLVHCGNHAAARAITSLLKLGIGFSHHLVIGAAFKCIETVLNNLGNYKKLLCAALHGESTASITVPKKLDMVSEYTDLLIDAMGVARHKNAPQNNANVFILGVLDCFPNTFASEGPLSEAMNITSPDFDKHCWAFNASLVELEWYSMMLSYCLRLPQRQLGPSLMPAYKDSVRRIYAFYRSSMLEVCRLNSTTWGPQPFAQSRGRRSYLDLLDLTQKDDSTQSVTGREFLLRVVSPSGALLREDIDIVASRVVYLAPMGTVLTASDRKCCSDGSIRFRTALGWLSEFRRDKEKMPLVEVLEVKAVVSRVNCNFQEQPDLMTVRESTGCAIGRIHVALKQVAVYLARSMIAQTPTSRSIPRSFVLADGAGVIATSLSRIVKGLCVSAFDSMDASEVPASSGMFSALAAEDVETLKTLPSLSTQHTSLDSPSLKDGDGDGAESMTVDAKTICLYQGAVMKYIILPILEDNSGHMNMYLLEKFLGDSVVESVVDSFAFVVSVLFDASDGREASAQLSAAGRCALGVLPAFLSFFRKMSSRAAFARSPVLALLADTTESDFMCRFFMGLAAKLLPVFRSHAFAALPSDIQKEWMEITGCLVVSLRSPASVEKPVATSGAEQEQDRNAETAQLRRIDAPPFTPTEDLIRCLSLMGYEEAHVREAALSARSNNIDDIVDRINRMQVARGEAGEHVSDALDLLALEGAEAAAPVDEKVLRIDSTHLASVADIVERRTMEYVTKACDSIDLVSRWSSSKDPQIIAPFLATSVSVMKAHSSALSIGPMIEHLLSSISSSDTSDASLHCQLHLILLVIRNAELSTELTSSISSKIFLTVLTILRKNVGFTESPVYPEWMSPALLVMNELCILVNPKQARSSSKESELDFLLEGDKQEDTAALSEGGKVPSHSTAQSTVNELYLLSEADKRDLLSIVLTLLKNNYACPLLPDLCHAMFLLLCTLLASNKFGSEFVSSNGWNYVFALKKESQFRDSSMLLNLLARRCFETVAELKTLMILEMKNTLSGLTMPIHLEGFLELTKSLYTRSSEVYFDALSCCAKLVRRKRGEVVVIALEDDARHVAAEAKTPEEQVQLTLAALMRHATGEPSPAALFSSTDALEALSDCAICLRGVPPLISTYALGSNGAALTLPLFIVRSLLSLDSRNGSAHQNLVKAGFRMLCVLCAHRGLSRRHVLDAIIDTLQNHKNTNLDQLKHIGVLISYIVKTSKPLKEPKPLIVHGAAPSNQNVCVDVVHHLMSAHLSQLVTACLSSLNLSESGSHDVFEALIEPLETITRPQLLNHLKALNLKPNREAAVEKKEVQFRSDAETKDDSIFDNSLQSSGDPRLANAFQVLRGEHHADDDGDHEEEEDDEGDDENSDEGDDDDEEDEENDEEEENDEDNEGNDEDAEDDEIMMAENEIPSGELPDYDHFLSAQNTMDMNLEDFYFAGANPRRNEPLTRGDRFLELDESNRIDNSLLELLMSSGGRDVEMQAAMGGTAGMTLFRLLEGRRPANVLRADNRDTMTMESYSHMFNELSRSACASEAVLGTAPRFSGGDVFGSLESNLQVRRQPLRHQLLDRGDDEPRSRSELELLREFQRREAIRLPSQSSFASPLMAAAFDGDDIAVPTPFPVRQTTSSGALADGFAPLMGTDTGLRLSTRGASALSNAVFDVLVDSFVTDEPPSLDSMLLTDSLQLLTANSSNSAATGGAAIELSLPAILVASEAGNALSSAASEIDLPDLAPSSDEEDNLDVEPSGESIHSTPDESGPPAQLVQSEDDEAPGSDPAADASYVASFDNERLLRILGPGIDRDVFHSLPIDLQMNILGPYRHSSDEASDAAIAGWPEAEADAATGVLSSTEIVLNEAAAERLGLVDASVSAAYESIPDAAEDLLEALVREGYSISPPPWTLPADEAQQSASEGGGSAAPVIPCPEGYEAEVFYSLPVELQMEMAEQHAHTSDQTRLLVEAAGFDMETINALPESIRREILEQARRDYAVANPETAPAAAPAEIDNASFLFSLPPELRAEVLLTAGPALLGTLPPELVAEASAYREHAALRWEQRGMTGDHGLDDGEEDHEQDAPRVARAEPEPRRDGKMVLPAEDVANTFVPNALIAVFAKVLVKLDFLVSPSLHRVLHNISKNPAQRDLMLKVVTCLLIGDSDAASGAFGDSRVVLQSVFSGEDTQTSASAGRPNLRLTSGSHSTQQMYNRRMRRLILTLRHLAVSNTSVVYELLRGRKSRLGPYSDATAEEGESSFALLELIVNLFSTEFCNTTAELSELIGFVDLVCSPLDSLPLADSIKATSQSKSESVEVTDAPSSAEPHNAADDSTIVSVDVPRVRLSRSSLNSICELLLSDACTKPIFKQVMSVTSRLAKIPSNRETMVEFVQEVTVQLGGQSQERLDAVLYSVSKVAGVDYPKKSVGSSSLGLAGTRQHECFLQSLLVLFALISRGNAKVSQLGSLDSLNNVWMSLDRLLTALGSFVNLTAPSSRQQSMLNSLLARVVPVVESFFLLHSHDLLKEGVSGDLKSADAEDESSESVRLRSMPGTAHRQTAEFRSMNISVSFDGSEDRAVMARTRSSLSLVRTTSRQGASVPATASVQRLLSFVQSHAGVVNSIVRTHPQLLENSLSAMIRFTPLRSLLVFDNKRTYFFSQFQKRLLSGRNRRGIHIQVRREQIFEDSFRQLRARSKEDLRGRLQVTFHGEEGVDAGGLTREWYLTLSREIFNPNYALFSPVDGATFQPNPLSTINTNHLDYFKFIGRVIGKAISDGHLMDAHFSRSFYKHVLGAPVDYSDLEALEPDYYKSLKQILNIPIESLGLDLTFSADMQKFGKQEVIDLVPNGRSIPVTDDNKFEYVQLTAQHRMTTGIRSQIDAFLNGFYELVPPELITIFSPTELELLICGLPDVDIEELKQYTEYSQFRITDSNIIWFWEVLKTFNREERALFLLFVTGTSKVPLGGFANLEGMRGVQRFSIHKAYGDTNKLPTAHTCFNQLDLPVYESKEQLRDKLVLAIKEGSEGFGFA